jgi:hypothetical protein
MNPATSPLGNPFSPQATVVIEGSGSADINLPTLMRPSIERLETLVERYQSEYRRDGSGRAIAVHGDHGSGKTHALTVSIRDLASHEDRSVAVRTIYVRADDRSAVALYRKAMTQLPHQELRELCAEARASYARDELAQSRRVSPAYSFEAIESLAADEDWVAKAFDARELQPSAVMNRQVADLDRLGLGRQDFERAIPSLLNPDLTEIAYRWLTGSELNELDLRRLGVAGNIADPMQVRMGIQALLILSRRAGQPLALFIDQAESFACRDEDTLDQENVGLLRAVVESVPVNSGLLVMAIKQSAWAMLPEDLVARFGPSEILITGLSVREAADLTELYISHWAGGTATAFSILPDGLRELLRSSAGNVREFLQLCSVLFAAAAPQGRRVDGEFARQVLSQSDTPVPTRSLLRRDLTAKLLAAGLSFQSDVAMDDRASAEVDFQITNAANEVRAFLVVTDALFGPREAAVVRSTIGLVRNANQPRQSRPAEVVLVVGGYMSADLASDLGEVHRVIVVTSATRERQLSQLVTSLAEPQASAGDTAVLLQQLDALQTAVAELEARRDAESSMLRDQVAALSMNQVAARRTDELDDARRKWRDELDGLTDEVRVSREARRAAEITELERLRRQAQTERYWLLGGLSALCVAMFTAAGAGLAIDFFAYWGEGALLGLLAGVVVMGAVLYAMLAPASTRDLAGPVGSQAELDRLAHAFIDKRSGLFSGTGQLLRNRNPQFRYAATLLPPRYRLRAFSAAIAAERSAIVRRAMARSMVKQFGPDGFKTLLASEGADPAISVAFEGPKEVLDIVAPELEEFTDVSAELRIVACLYGITAPRSGFVGTFLEALRSRSSKAQDLEVLAKAFEREDDDAMLSVLGGFTEREFRNAATLLSPLEAGRVGTYDWLVKISEVDQLFYFFRKCLFYLGRGLEDRPGDPSANST